MHNAKNGTPRVPYCYRIIVKEVKMKDVMTTNDKLRPFDSDFGDINTKEVPIKRVLSREDNIFLKTAESGNWYTDGRYILL